MIRERRNKQKLYQYYRRFFDEGVVDPNVHPWVAKSWERCQELNLRHDKLPLLVQLSRQELAVRRERHRAAIEYIDGLYNQTREHFNIYNLSMLLIDTDCYVLKNYALPFYQRTLDDVEGARVAEQDIGTSSISIALEHKVPFLIFGPEMWIEECHNGDACAAPVIVNGQVKYIVSMFSVYQDELPYNAVVSLLLSMKYGLEHYLETLNRIKAAHILLDSLPMAVYHVKPNGDILYANKRGNERLNGANNLSEKVLNYSHLPLTKAFAGVPSYNKEITWITPEKTYEDITTVVPVKTDGDIASIIAMSTSIEDLETMAAHATSYTARYSLSSLVGASPIFRQMQAKALRAAKSDHHVLLQGESGIGKQRLAHGIHQASPRVAGPLITVRCGDLPVDRLEVELFGVENAEGQILPGKIEIASGGTLFIDEIEKMPMNLAKRLAKVLETGSVACSPGKAGKDINVRVIAACDSNLKRLADKKLFSSELYEIISKITLRIPSLRDRKEDIPILAEHIIREIAEQHNIEHKQLSPEALRLLEGFSWPGNIKQLQTVLETAFFQTAGDVIAPRNIKLPNEVERGRAWKYDRDAFIEAWRSAGGNISKLANVLDVSRVTLYRYLKKYGLDKTNDDEE